jgi:hypothetical protein
MQPGWRPFPSSGQELHRSGFAGRPSGRSRPWRVQFNPSSSRKPQAEIISTSKASSLPRLILHRYGESLDRTRASSRSSDLEQRISTCRSRQQAEPRLWSAVVHGAIEQGFTSDRSPSRTGRLRCGVRTGTEASRWFSTSRNFWLPSCRGWVAPRVGVGNGPRKPWAVHMPSSAPEGRWRCLQRTWSVASTSSSSPRTRRFRKLIRSVWPRSQVASWSAEFAPFSSEPTRRVTGISWHWEPSAEHGGAGCTRVI